MLVEADQHIGAESAEPQQPRIAGLEGLIALECAQVVTVQAQFGKDDEIRALRRRLLDLLTGGIEVLRHLAQHTVRLRQRNEHVPTSSTHYFCGFHPNFARGRGERHGPAALPVPHRFKHPEDGSPPMSERTILPVPDTASAR